MSSSSLPWHPHQAFHGTVWNQRPTRPPDAPAHACGASRCRQGEGQGAAAWPPGRRSQASPHNKPQAGGHAPRSRVIPPHWARVPGGGPHTQPPPGAPAFPCRKPAQPGGPWNRPAPPATRRRMAPPTLVHSAHFGAVRYLRPSVCFPKPHNTKSTLAPVNKVRKLHNRSGQLTSSS